MHNHDSLDRRLDSELGPELDRAAGGAAPPFPRYRSIPAARGFRLRGLGLLGVPLAVSLRTAAALAAAAIAVGGGTAVAVSSHLGTGSTQSTLETAQLNATSSNAPTGHPSNHGSVVTSAVASCKAARPSPDASPKPSPGSRGIGECVSAVASGGRSHNGGSGPSHPAQPAHPTPPPHPTPPAHS
ncbi:MAG TPA: hypothetical protein VH498_10165 [Candidatus Dormibacteraeota bacterium]|jgi:hypothetical protein|nr:hypothetical protein [Candidatus Dormibacteraeota bacterium]